MPGGESSGISNATIAAIAVASALGFLLFLCCAGLFFLNRRRRQKQARRQQPIIIHKPLGQARPMEAVQIARGVSIDPFSEQGLIGDSELGHEQKSPVPPPSAMLNGGVVQRQQERPYRSLFGSPGLLAPPQSPLQSPKPARVNPPGFLDLPRSSPFKVEFRKYGSSSDGSRGARQAASKRSMTSASSRSTEGSRSPMMPRREGDARVSFLDFASSAASSLYSSRSRSRARSWRTASNGDAQSPTSSPSQRQTLGSSGRSRAGSTGFWSLSLSIGQPTHSSIAATSSDESPARHPYSISRRQSMPPISPTESIPISVSDINFRVEEEEENHGAGRPRLTPHPPLPGTPRSAPALGSFRSQQAAAASTGDAPEEPRPYVAQTLFGRRLAQARAQAQESSLPQSPSPSQSTQQPDRPSPVGTRGLTHARGGRSRSLGFMHFGRKEGRDGGA